MALPNAAFTWAATRSGLSLGDFMASLTPEREDAILKEYNDWRVQKGLKPLPASASTPAPSAKPANVHPQKQADDEFVELLSSVAEEMDQEALEEAEALQKTLAEIDSIPVEEDAVVPEEVEEEIEESIESSGAEEMPEVPAIEAEEPAGPVDIDARISGLPKAAEPALYEDLLTRIGDVAAAIEAAKAKIADNTRRHRGTAAQRAFLAWLKESI